MFALTLLCIGCIAPLMAESTISSVIYQLSSHDIQSLPSPTPHKNIGEDSEKELMIGASLAKELDLYRAITSFKRAKILAQSSGNYPAYTQAEFSLALAYYMGGKYENCIQNFESSSLESLTHESTYYKTLLLILFDSYLHTKNYRKAANVLAIATQFSRPLGKTLREYQAIATGDLLQKKTPSDGAEREVYSAYYAHMKSPFRAGLYNAILPGAGYFYVGQVQSGITSFLLNALFIAATHKFFQDGQVAAGIITLGFEFGWYFGGIKGANLAAKQYNDLLYSTKAKEVMRERKIFPILLLDVGF